MTGAYYNEHDPFAAAWLRELIKAGHIADGDVDERSVEDVVPNELAGFTQCHFFAGIGVWSYALRKSGWPDDRPVWTGSCPCQPFSAAGKGEGFADERHLWPAFFHLIKERRPAKVFGEQVEAAIKHGWLDLVQSDLEGIGYTFGTACTPSAGVGATDIRSRTWFVGDSIGSGLEGLSRDGNGINQPGRHEAQQGGSIATAGADGELANRNQNGRITYAKPGRNNEEHNAESCGEFSLVADTISIQRGAGRGANSEQEGAGLEIRIDANGRGRIHRTTCAPARSTHWDDADWLFCTDEKWRAVEPGTFPLAHGATNRVGRLRGYGNAINAAAAQAFIESCLA